MDLVNLDERAVPDPTDTPIIAVVGRVDPTLSIQLAGRLRELLATGARHLVVDVSEAHDVHGALLTVLAHARAELAGGAGEPVAGSLRVTGVALPQFLAALDTAALDEVFVVYDAVRSEHPPSVSTAARLPHPRRSVETAVREPNEGSTAAAADAALALRAAAGDA